MGDEMGNVEFFKGAIEQSATPFMMIDRDFVVTYVNRATLDLLAKHEATLQRKYPGFRADIDL